METSAAGEKSERWANWRWILWTIVIVGIVPLLYFEENFRGGLAIRSVQRYWQDRGETFAFTKFVPPSVPDDQNLALVPLFELKPDPSSTGSVPYMIMPALRAATLNGKGEYPSYGRWTTGNPVDNKKRSQELEEDYKLTGLTSAAPTDDLALFDATYPFIDQLRADAEKRSQFRVPMDYATDPPLLRNASPITSMIEVTQFMTGHGVLALDHGRPDMALGDFNVAMSMTSASGREPTLVGGLVAIGSFMISGNIVYHGLALHAWNDGQLAAINDALGKLDFLKMDQFTMRGETASMMASVPYIKAHLGQAFTYMDKGDFVALASTVAPRGWVDLNDAAIVNERMEDLRNIDPATRTVKLSAIKANSVRLDAEADSWMGKMPWRILYTSVEPSLENAVKKFVRVQVWLDELRIAVALERYRLAHGMLPAKLDDLSPQFLSTVPHDLFDGKPYRYTPNTDGTYLLYSIGWNGTDDSGVMGFTGAGGNFPDDDQGDWVWPMPKK